MNSVIAAFHEEVFVKRDAAVTTDIKFHHPTSHTVRIELLVPRGVK